MGKSSNSQNNRAMLDKNEQSEIYTGVKSNIKKLAGPNDEPANCHPNQDIGKIVTFRSDTVKQVNRRAQEKLTRSEREKNV